MFHYWICATVALSDRQSLCLMIMRQSAIGRLWTGGPTSWGSLDNNLLTAHPGKALTHLYPVAVFIQSRLKRPVKFSERELFTAVRSKHRCTIFAGSACYSYSTISHKYALLLLYQQVILFEWTLLTCAADSVFCYKSICRHNLQLIRIFLHTYRDTLHNWSILYY